LQMTGHRTDGNHSLGSNPSTFPRCRQLPSALGDRLYSTTHLRRTSTPAHVAEELPIIWRIAIDEFDREAELVCIEIRGTLDVRNEELRRN